MVLVGFVGSCFDVGWRALSLGLRVIPVGCYTQWFLRICLVQNTMCGYVCKVSMVRMCNTGGASNVGMIGVGGFVLSSMAYE